MLRITQQVSADAAKSYYSQADYLSEGQELVGIWGGKGAERLGLVGEVAKPAFDALCENRDPRTGDRLTLRTNEKRTAGYDFTWSVPKSVSLLYARTEDPTLLTAFRDAVEATMREIEADMRVRVRKGKTDGERVTGNAVWATFVHTTSRPIDGVPDPQLHAHSFVFNGSFDERERIWKAGQFRELKRDAPYYQAAFRARLATRLQAEGYSLAVKKDDFEIAGIAKPLLARFSRRTTKIEETAHQKGITDPDRKAELGPKTREKKDLRLNWASLKQEWDARLNDAERRLLDRAAVRTEPVRPKSRDGEAVDFAIAHRFERESVVDERQLLAEALRRGLGAVTPEPVTQALRARRLPTAEVDGRRRVTTPESIRQEREVVDFARKGRGRFSPLVGKDRPLSRTWLNEGQRRAVTHLWNSTDRVMLLRGAAGTGKTTLLQEAVEGIEASGRAVAVLAPSAQASRGVLRSEGFSAADTVTQFLVDEGFQARTRGGVILIDEAGLIGVPTLQRVFRTAERLQARVVLVGDPKQHRSVEKGDVFHLLGRDASLPVAEVVEVQRQKGDYRKAVECLSAGQIAEGFGRLDSLGFVEEVGAASVSERIAAEYVTLTAPRREGGAAKSVLVVSPTRAEGAKITSAIRGELKRTHRLGEERVLRTWEPLHRTEAERGDFASYTPGEMLQFHRSIPGRQSGSRLVVETGTSLPLPYADRFQVYAPRELAVATGDRLRVTANGRTKDGKHRLHNGAVVTVKAFTPTGDLVLDNGWTVAKEFGHLTHGYVSTSFSSQGRTVDVALVGQTAASYPASSSGQFYVSASRARESLHVFTDDKRGLLRAVSREESRPTASELGRLATRDHFRTRLKELLARVRRRGTLLPDVAPIAKDREREYER